MEIDSGGGLPTADCCLPTGSRPATRDSRLLVSVIVPNWNGAAWLGECLESLERQDYPTFEVLVVDNGSTDRSRQVVAGLGRTCQWIACPENLGFAGGVNAGLQYCRGQLVALLNNDAVAAPDWLTELVNGLRQAQAGMAACKILRYEQPGIIDKAGHLIYWDGQNRGRGSGQLDAGQFDRPEETLFPDGCAALYASQLLEQTGGLDPRFFAYADDADVGLRARLLGWRCVYVPTAVVRHRRATTAGRFSSARVTWIERNRLWLAIKCLPIELLLASPLFTAWRFLWNGLSLLGQHGEAAGFRRQRSSWELIGAVWAAYRQGFAQIRGVWRSRRLVQSSRRIGRGQLFRLLWRFRIGARRMAVED